MLVHLFGKKDSPCVVANWALKGCVSNIKGVDKVPSLKSLCEIKRKDVIEVILKNFYMDDYLGSFDTMAKAMATSSNLSKVVGDGKFNLLKWMSYDTSFLQSFKQSKLSSKITNYEFKELPSERALGV